MPGRYVYGDIRVGSKICGSFACCVRSRASNLSQQEVACLVCCQAMGVVVVAVDGLAIGNE